MTRQEIEVVFSRMREALVRLDADALASLHTETCVVDSPAGGTHSGRAAIANVYRGWFAAFPDFKVLSDELVIEGDPFHSHNQLSRYGPRDDMTCL
ncbi:MAG: ester cyclase [Vicinamibacterales bacterium]|nr:ester cyclase [Vicinamibacterales bacterium]